MTGHGHDSPKRPWHGPKASNVARRIHGWSWQGYPMGMGTGAVMVLLNNLHDHPPWVTKIEIAFFILNFIIFVANGLLLTLQFVLFRKQWVRLIYDPVKGVFVPLIVLSFATLIIGSINYLVPAGAVGQREVLALFYLYTFFAFAVCFPMLCIWFNKPHDINTFTPAWAFLVFPMMLVGIVAINALRVLDLTTQAALDVLIIGYVCQGLGVGITFMYLTIYILRIMQTGFMEGHQANGAFVACGPPGFTALALIRLGDFARTILPARNLDLPSQAGEIWYSISVVAALMLLGIALFFAVFAALPYWWKVHKHLSEILGVWALTFPQVGYIVAMKALGDVFQSQIMWTTATILTVIICLIYAVLFPATLYAMYKGAVLFNDHEAVWKDVDESKVALITSPESDKSQHGGDGAEHSPDPFGEMEKGNGGKYAISGPRI